jgi:large subunit ribosomal protein L4e
LKATVLDLNGNAVREVDLPKQFAEPLRIDLIRRAFHAETTLGLQPHGAFPLAGFQNTAEYVGRRRAWRSMINIGRARLPKEKLPKGRFGRVLVVPQAVKGRRAHPPKPWKKIVEKINLKEKNKALRSGIAATMDKELVEARGHVVGKVFPLILDSTFEEIGKAKALVEALEKLGLGGELQRAEKKRRKRTGVSGRRRGGYKEPAGVLIVASGKKPVLKAASSVVGVEAVDVKELNALELAPGGVPGRLTVWSEKALQEMGERHLFE